MDLKKRTQKTKHKKKEVQTMGIYTIIKVAEGTTKAAKIAKALITTGRVAITVQTVVDAVKEYKERKESAC